MHPHITTQSSIRRRQTVALTKCKECGNEVSTKASNCPKCGAPVKTEGSGCAGRGCLVIIGLIVISAIISQFADNNKSKNSAPTTPKTQAELRKEQVEKQFSAWDGSHRGLTRFIKNSMNDPDSYEHVKTVYLDKGDYLIVKTTFRGKNAFGGVVVNWIQAKVDLNGNVIEVLAQGP